MTAKRHIADAYGNTQAFDANGTPLAGFPDPYSGFGGQHGYYTDVETGLILCTYRYYDPNVGRWINRDPIGYRGGVNIYAYVNGNPITRTDALGLDYHGFPYDGDVTNNSSSVVYTIGETARNPHVQSIYIVQPGESDPFGVDVDDIYYRGNVYHVEHPPVGSIEGVRGGASITIDRNGNIRANSGLAILVTNPQEIEATKNKIRNAYENKTVHRGGTPISMKQATVARYTRQHPLDCSAEFANQVGWAITVGLPNVIKNKLGW